jgi:NADH dehydrogenase FAD-containing subunit
MEATPPKDLPRKQAVILGGGFAGVSLAIALEKLSRVDVILIDSKDRFVYTPSLCQLVANPAKIDSICVRYRSVLKRGKFIQANIEQLTRTSVVLSDQEVGFDYCFICTGSYYKVPGVSKRTTTNLGSDFSNSLTLLSPSENRKTPRRKRRPSSSSSKHSHSFSISRRFKAIFSDPVVGPMFYSFVALRPELIREYRALQLLREIDLFEASLGVIEKRSSSSSSSSASTGSVNRACRKHFSAIIQQFLSPGSASEVRFVLMGHDTVKEALLSQEAKYIEPSVFKAARRAIMMLLAETALEAFFDAAAIPIAPLALPARTRRASASSTNASVHSAASTPPSSPREQGSTTTETKEAENLTPISTASSGKNRTASASIPVSSAVEGNSSLNSPIRSHTRAESAETKTKRRRSAPKHYNSRDPKQKRVSAPSSSQNAATVSNSTTSNASSTNLQISTSNIASSSTTASTSNGAAQIVTSARTQRLVMEIHDLQFSSVDGSPSTPSGSASASGTPTTSQRVYNGSPRSTSSVVSGPKRSGESIFHVNQRYPSLIPPMKTLEPLSANSFTNLGELEGLEAAARVVVVGGDFVAIELAAEIHNKYPRKMLTLVHSHRHLLVSMGESVRLIVDNFFKNRNIVVHRKKHVVGIQPLKYQQNPEYFHILLDDGTTLEADKVYCCNVDYQHGNTLFLQHHFSDHLDGRGFAKVDRFLRFANCDNIFALGDVAALNEHKLAERARAHASLVSANLQRILHGLELETYRERPIPKTYDLILAPNKGVQIENGRFVRIGPGPVERRDFAERRVLHRFGALSLVLAKKWTIQQSSKGTRGTEDETAGSRGETSSDAAAPKSKKESRKRPLRRLSDNAAEEDSDEVKERQKPSS